MTQASTTRCILAIFTLAVGILSLLPGTLRETAADEREGATIQYNRDVRPILAENCFACHGPDANKREADLRLDQSNPGALDLLSPGAPDKSQLLERLTTDDPDLRMPPGSVGKSLTDAQVATLKGWIEQGAEWEAHWSLIPPRKPELPQGESVDAQHNPIDKFVVRKLEAEGRKPAPVADRRTLLRRLYFDLIGLPPSPQQVRAFEQSSSESAYEHHVDELLKSPHFGERLALYWLDVVRYSDTGGYHSDNHRDVAPYRDYVIRSFNQNLPFDRFTVEQLAGDLLPNATNQQRVASGYNKLLQTTQEGGAQAKEYTAKYQADRVRNTATAWLGITMGCAECHDHKFDPFSMRDFYRFAAFFADIREVPVGQQPQTALPTLEQETRLAELAAELKPLDDAFQQATPAGQGDWEQEVLADVDAGKWNWRPFSYRTLKTEHGSTLTAQEDQSVLGSGKDPRHEIYHLDVDAIDGTLAAIQLEALTHESHAKKSLSRNNGNFVLTGFEAEVLREGKDAADSLKFARAVADFEQGGFPIAATLDNKQDTGWAVEGHQKVADRRAIFYLSEPLTLKPGDTLRLRMKHQSRHGQHQIGRFRLGWTPAADVTLDGNGPAAELVAAMRTKEEDRTDAQRKMLLTAYREVAPELEELRRQRRELADKRDAIRKAFPQTLVSEQVTPRMVRILPRGNWLDDSGEVVEPGVPAAFPELAIEDRQQARLDLARWMVAPENPLTARVFVNRVWKLLLGQGLVPSLDDFGTQGQMPSHPDLLDFLAVDFMEHGWDVKRLIKQIVLSNTYRQSSNATAELLEADPTNRLLARQSRFRFEAEVVRDSALAVSGLLTEKVGGPSVKPYQPVGYWKHLNFPRRKWVASQGEDAYRRGLYTYWQRSFLHPSLMAFDAPSREECTVERPRSNTPLQALVLLNDPTYVESARMLAVRGLKSADSPAAQVGWMFQEALQRDPDSDELQLLMQLREQHLQDLQGNEPEARELLQIGASPAPDDVKLVELAALASVARVILNLHETITRY